MRIRPLLLTALTLIATAARAEPPGLPSGDLLPQGTVSLSLGSSQTTPGASGGQTGRQVYTGALRYRGQGPWQWGTSFEVFDDTPAQPIGGRVDDISHLSLGVQASYQLTRSARLSTMVQGAGQWVYLSRGAPIVQQGNVPDSDKSKSLAMSLSASASYRITSDTWVSGRLGAAYLARAAAGGPGFGSRASASLGLAHRWSDRLMTYGSVKAVHRLRSDSFDAGRRTLYTAGAQIGLTPQSDLTLYVTNAFGTTPIGGDLLFYGDTNAPTFGAVATYRPSGQGTAAPRFGPPVSQSVTTPAPLTLPETRSLPTDRMTARLSYGEGAAGVALRYAPDPLIELNFAAERLILARGSDFRTDRSPRYSLGGRWQAMDRAQGQPFDLSLHVSAGRDVTAPTLGVIEAGAAMGTAIGPVEVTIAPRAALFADRRIVALGLGASYALTPQITAMAETHLLRGDAPSWALTARYQPEQLPVTFDLYATNAAGLSGIGPLLSNDRPHFGVAVTWQMAAGWL